MDNIITMCFMRKSKKYTKLYDSALKKCVEKGIGDLMCKKLNELRGRSAEDILNICGQAQNVPINLEVIINKLGIYKYPKTFEDIEQIEKRGHIAGLVLLNGDDVGIFYNSNDTIAQKRFTIAHEIGHCCLHGETLQNGYIEFLHKDGFENNHEIEATVFASRLLIPKEPLLLVYSKLILPSLNGLSDIFEVPKKLMIHRLRELKMSYFIDETGKLVKV